VEADDATHIRHVYDTEQKTVAKKSVMESLFTRIINDIEKIFFTTLRSLHSILRTRGDQIVCFSFQLLLQLVHFYFVY